MRLGSTYQTCSIDGCDEIVFSRGWCQKHYFRWRRHGDPLVILTGHGLNAEQRFWRMVDVQPDGCWLWKGRPAAGTGYGIIKTDEGPLESSHRFSYKLSVGPIPDGKDVCHKCDVRLCVRPDHLFVGDPIDNMQDMISKGRGWWQDPERKARRNANYMAAMAAKKAATMATVA